MSGLEIHLPELSEIVAKLDAVLEGRTLQEFFTIEQAWRRKFAGQVDEGSISLATLKNTRALQPRGGKEDGWISNRRVWRAATVEEWLTVDDDGLADYLTRCGATARVPDRIVEAVRGRRRAALIREKALA